jgi:hypothetical protein
MNGKSCLYKNSKFVPDSPGDCPSRDENDDTTSDDCPREMPLLKDE